MDDICAYIRHGDDRSVLLSKVGYEGRVSKSIHREPDTCPEPVAPSEVFLSLAIRKSTHRIPQLLPQYLYPDLPYRIFILSKFEPEAFALLEPKISNRFQGLTTGGGSSSGKRRTDVHVLSEVDEFPCSGGELGGYIRIYRGLSKSKERISPTKCHVGKHVARCCGEGRECKTYESNEVLLGSLHEFLILSLPLFLRRDYSG